VRICECGHGETDHGDGDSNECDGWPRCGCKAYLPAAIVPLKRLRELEWSWQKDDVDYCPACGCAKLAGHGPECWLAALIREASDGP
jgi:hypothetical protein